MKKILFVLTAVLVFATVTNAQKQFGTRNGKISFLATDDDGVKAVNNEVTSRLADNGTISFSLLMKGFRFELAEMQEHFNDKYVESTKFPRADFKGTITNIKDINFTKDGVYKATAKGDLTMHGVTKNITVAGTITIKNGKPSVSAKFPIVMKDFKIDGTGVTSKVNADINCLYQ
jgi:hypothetical protein